MSKPESPDPEETIFDVQANPDNLADIVQARAAVTSARISLWALVLGFASIVIAAAVAYLQIAESTRQANAVEARSIYAEYLKLALENPDLAYGPDPDLGDPANAARLETRYDWFTSYAFNALERIVATQHGDPDWRCVIAEQLYWHRDRVAEQVATEEFAWSYDERLHSIAKQMLTVKPAPDPKQPEQTISAICKVVSAEPR